MKKRLWTLCLAVVTALCLCLGLAACGGDDEQPVATALSAPTNVAVSGTTLSWDAVEGATNGYTVKIGADETTKVGTGTSLDLVTVTDKLTVGDNSLAVKANGTDANPESAYSVSVTYTYSPTPAKTALAAPTGVELDGSTLKWNAVESATSGYTVKIGTDETTKVTDGTSLDLTTVTDKLVLGVNAISVKANETAENLESPYTALTGGYTHRTAYAAPANVKVEEDTLKWDAVEDATSYTVKIGSNETTTVQTTQLDLTSAAVSALLVSGANELSVKANANEAAYRTASPYSATVNYDFTPSAEKAVQNYKDLVAEIGTITANSHKADADEVKGELELADAAYAALQRDFPDSVSEVTTEHATHVQRQNDYDSVMETAQNLATAYENAVNEAKTVIDAKESLTTLTEKQTTADAAHGALSTLATDLVEAGVDDNYALIATTVTEWTNAINAEKTKLNAITDTTITDDASAETFLAALKENNVLDGYNALPGYVKNDSEVSEKYEAISDAKDTAENKLDATVQALQDDINNAKDKTAVTEENYKILKELQDRVNELGAYAKDKFDVTEESKTLAAAIEAMLAKVVKTETTETILYNSDKPAEMPSIVIVRKPLNIAGEGIKLDTDPTVTATEKYNIADGTQDEEAKDITPVVTWDEEAKAYIITITFSERLAYNSNDNTDTVEVTYQIDSEEEAHYTLRATKYITYFDTANNDAAYAPSGALNIAGGGGGATTYIDIYRAGDVVKGADRNTSVQFKGVRIAQVTKEAVKDKNELRRELASVGVTGDITVQLVAYQRWEDGGQTFFTAINSASVSAALELKDIRSEEAKYILTSDWLSATIEQSGAFQLYTPGRINELKNQINEYTEQTGVTFGEDSDLQKYMQARIRAINVDGDDITVLHEEVVEMSFIGTKLDDFISAWTIEYFKAHLDEYKEHPETADPEYTNVKFQICYEPKEKLDGDADNPLFKWFRAPEWKDVEQDQGAEKPKLTSFDITLHKADVSATSEALARFNGGHDAYEFLRAVGEGAQKVDAGGVFTKFHAKSVLFDISKTFADDKVVTLHLAFFYEKVNEEDATPTLQLWRVDENGEKATGDHAECTVADITNAVANSWCSLTSLDDWIKLAFSDITEATTFSSSEEGWQFKTKVIVKEESAEYGWFFDGEWSTPFTYPQG